VVSQKSPARCSQFLCVQRQAAAVRMFLGFFRFGILAFEMSDCHVERFVTQAEFGWCSPTHPPRVGCGIGFPTMLHEA
jgi:hypothetical protein